MEPGRGWATPLPTQNIARKLDPPHSLQVKLTSLLHPLQSASEDPGGYSASYAPASAGFSGYACTVNLYEFSLPMPLPSAGEHGPSPADTLYKRFAGGECYRERGEQGLPNWDRERCGAGAVHGGAVIRSPHPGAAV